MGTKQHQRLAEGGIGFGFDRRDLWPSLAKVEQGGRNRPGGY
ncbi:hypothetical protein ACTMSW_26410 [Micromonospora sp. BQ11]